MTAPSGAVVFAASDYATLGRRVGSCLIDLVVITIILAGLQAYFTFRYVPASVRSMPRSVAQQKLIEEHIRPHARGLTLLRLGLVGIYLVPIRRLPGGTIGYRIAGIRLVGPAGVPPDWLPLVKRIALLLVLGLICLMPAALLITAGRISNPMVQGLILLGVIAGSILLTYSPCPTRPRRQAVHDRWSGTWMIRKKASPSGPAVALFQTLFLGTFPVRYLDLEPVTTGADASADVAPPISAEAR
jgi:uncharacterized RDD family membrane protein YckC